MSFLASMRRSFGLLIMLLISLATITPLVSPARSESSFYLGEIDLSYRKNFEGSIDSTESVYALYRQGYAKHRNDTIMPTTYATLKGQPAVATFPALLGGYLEIYFIADADRASYFDHAYYYVYEGYAHLAFLVKIYVRVANLNVSIVSAYATAYSIYLRSYAHGAYSDVLSDVAKYPTIAAKANVTNGILVREAIIDAYVRVNLPSGFYGDLILVVSKLAPLVTFDNDTTKNVFSIAAELGSYVTVAFYSISVYTTERISVVAPKLKPLRNHYPNEPLPPLPTINARIQSNALYLLGNTLSGVYGYFVLSDNGELTLHFDRSVSGYALIVYGVTRTEETRIDFSGSDRTIDARMLSIKDGIRMHTANGYVTIIYAVFVHIDSSAHATFEIHSNNLVAYDGNALLPAGYIVPKAHTNISIFEPSEILNGIVPEPSRDVVSKLIKNIHTNVSIDVSYAGLALVESSRLYDVIFSLIVTFLEVNVRIVTNPETGAKYPLLSVSSIDSYILSRSGKDSFEVLSRQVRIYEADEYGKATRVTTLSSDNVTHYPLKFDTIYVIEASCTTERTEPSGATHAYTLNAIRSIKIPSDAPSYYVDTFKLTKTFTITRRYAYIATSATTVLEGNATLYPIPIRHIVAKINETIVFDDTGVLYAYVHVNPQTGRATLRIYGKLENGTEVDKYRSLGRGYARVRSGMSFLAAMPSNNLINIDIVVELSREGAISMLSLITSWGLAVVGSIILLVFTYYATALLLLPARMLTGLLSGKDPTDVLREAKDIFREIINDVISFINLLKRVPLILAGIASLLTGIASKLGALIDAIGAARDKAEKAASKVKNAIGKAINKIRSRLRSFFLKLDASKLMSRFRFSFGIERYRFPNGNELYVLRARGQDNYRRYRDHVDNDAIFDSYEEAFTEALEIATNDLRDLVDVDFSSISIFDRFNDVDSNDSDANVHYFIEELFRDILEGKISIKDAADAIIIDSIKCFYNIGVYEDAIDMVAEKLAEENPEIARKINDIAKKLTMLIRKNDPKMVQYIEIYAFELEDGKLKCVDVHEKLEPYVKQLGLPHPCE